MPRYAISDIHGCLDSFQQLLRQIDFGKGDTIYLLGDYVDRGPDSKGVIDFIWELQSQGYDLRCLRGNHEEIVLSYLSASPYPYHDPALLRSFGVDHYRDIPSTYYEWMDGLDYYFETDGYLLAHAGLDLRREHPLQDRESMLWMRGCEKNVSFEWLAGRTIVHGHTPIPKTTMEYRVSRLQEVPVLDIDGGCVFAHRPGLGYLAAFNLDNQTLTFVKRPPHTDY
jgi:serine/threonine protein phosphatase 1